ncbi:MAG: ABC transporter permease [bacterium]|nr:ABC transporter permease [bacterium]
MTKLPLFNKGFQNAVLSLALKTIKLRYKNSFLGIFWSMLNPLIFLTILIIVFKQINHIEHFALYALTGLIFWNFISASILQVLTSFIDNASILKSINLHPFCFPLSAMVAAVFNLMLTLLPFFVIMFFLGYEMNWSFLAFFPFTIITAIFVLGLGMFMGTVNVFFRDIQLLWTTIIPAFFYFTPIAYTPELLNENQRFLLKLNPFYYFVESYHDIFYRSVFPSFENFGMSLFIALLSITIGYAAFNKYRKGFISNI